MIKQQICDGIVLVWTHCIVVIFDSYSHFKLFILRLVVSVLPPLRHLLPPVGHYWVHFYNPRRHGKHVCVRSGAER